MTQKLLILIALVFSLLLVGCQSTPATSSRVNQYFEQQPVQHSAQQVLLKTRQNPSARHLLPTVAEPTTKDRVLQGGLLTLSVIRVATFPLTMAH